MVLQRALEKGTSINANYIVQIYCLQSRMHGYILQLSTFVSVRYKMYENDKLDTNAVNKQHIAVSVNWHSYFDS